MRVEFCFNERSSQRIWHFQSDNTNQSTYAILSSDKPSHAHGHFFHAAQPAVLSVTFPHKRKLHYWAKSGLFKVNKLATTILLDAGNLPVDRKEKNNQARFQSLLLCSEQLMRRRRSSCCSRAHSTS